MVLELSDKLYEMIMKALLACAQRSDVKPTLKHRYMVFYEELVKAREEAEKKAAEEAEKEAME